MDVPQAMPLFLAVAEDLNFTRAARRLGLSPSATGKAIARLEAQLGQPLFQRTTRAVRLTDAGEILLGHARAMREQWREAEAALAQARDEPRGCLRVAVPTIGHRLIGPHLRGFRERYPAISLDIEQDDRLADLTADTVDLAIRSGDLPDSTHGSRLLTRFRFLLCASPDYLDRCGLPLSVANLHLHAQVRFRWPATRHIQPWRLASKEQDVLGDIALVTTNVEGVHVAALAGLGLAQLPEFLVRSDIAAGRLHIVDVGNPPLGQFWLVWPHDRNRMPTTRALIDHLILGFAASSIESCDETRRGSSS